MQPEALRGTPGIVTGGDVLSREGLGKWGRRFFHVAKLALLGRRRGAQVGFDEQP